MAGNPQVPQGILNKVRGAINFATNQALNITAPFLGRDGISMGFEGKSATKIPTMTGTVVSPEVYQLVTLTVHLLKTQALAAAFKAQIELNCAVGDLTVKGDATTLPDYVLHNAVILGNAELMFAGTNPDFTIQIQGDYNVNSSIFSTT